MTISEKIEAGVYADWEDYYCQLLDYLVDTVPCLDELIAQFNEDEE